MTKKILFGMFAAVGLLATSCSDDELNNSLASGDYVNAYFSIETPEGILTRAIGDGTQADKVACAIFYNGEELSELRKTVDVTSKTATYNVRLAKGQKYQAVFFAYNEAADAYNLENMKAIEVKTDQSCNAENRDAFTASVEVTTANTNINQEVILYRPFAQLNIGSTNEDIAAATAAGITVKQTKVKVTGVYTTFNALTDKVVGEPIEVTYSLANIPEETEKLKVTVNGQEKEYTYLALNYLLVGDKDSEKSLTNVEFTFKPENGSENTITFENVPVQRNYRTNIIGAVLTNPAQFNIVIDSKFEEPDYLSWNGVFVKEPKQDANGNYLITSAYELNWLAMQTRGEQPGTTRAAGTPNNFTGKTIKLENDIDCGGNYIQPIGDNTVSGYPSNSFAGTFDGQNKTISNFKVKTTEPVYAAAGLFGTITGHVKNVNVDNAEISSTHYVGGIVGYIGANTGASVEGCKVTNSTITSTTELVNGEWDNGDKAGGIVGYLSPNDKVLNCIVGGNTTIKAYRDLGGIVGCSQNGIVKGNKIDGSTVYVTVDATHNYKKYTSSSSYNAGHIIGRDENSTIENNTGTCTLNVPANVVSVKTAAELKELLTQFTASGAGDNTINIEDDIILADGENWESITVQGYTGAGKITINGNGHYISGLNASLFEGGFAGSSGIIINKLTIKDSEMIASDNNQGFGTFIKSIDSMPYIELNGCKAENVTITAANGNSARIGGLIGWSAGYNNENDGPVDTYIYVKNCEVFDCKITANGSVGGIIGHAGNNPATYHFIENCVVENCTLTANDGSWRAGAIVGTANVGEVTITNCTDRNNTISMTWNGSTLNAPADFHASPVRHLYGRTVFGSTGKLTINSVAIQ